MYKNVSSKIKFHKKLNFITFIHEYQSGLNWMCY